MTFWEFLGLVTQLTLLLGVCLAFSVGIGFVVNRHDAHERRIRERQRIRYAPFVSEVRQEPDDRETFVARSEQASDMTPMLYGLAHHPDGIRLGHLRRPIRAQPVLRTQDLIAGWRPDDLEGNFEDLGTARALETLRKVAEKRGDQRLHELIDAVVVQLACPGLDAPEPPAPGAPSANAPQVRGPLRGVDLTDE